MANVLPKRERTSLQRNYLLRVVIVGTIIMTSAVIIGFVSLVPVYIFAQAQLKEVTMERKIQERIRNINKKDTIARSARTTNTEIQSVMNTKSAQASTAIQYIIRDWSNNAKDIVISSFIFESKGEAIRVRISGEARTRQALNSFINILQTDSRFGNVTFPISDLVNNKKIDFSVTMLFK